MARTKCTARKSTGGRSPRRIRITKDLEESKRKRESGRKLGSDKEAKRRREEQRAREEEEEEEKYEIAMVIDSEIKRQRFRAVRAENEMKRHRIHITFEREPIRAYFQSTAAEGTFRRCMEDKINSSVCTKLSELDWEFEGDKRNLLKILKIALGGRLYSRDLIGMWCEEGLATVHPADNAETAEGG